MCVHTCMCAIVSIKVDRLYLGKVEYITLFKSMLKGVQLD